MDKQPAVYGVTNNLVGRIWQHREHVIDGFTQRYDVSRLVWYQLTEAMDSAILREKQVKKWNRAWKIRLIEEMNPGWRDLWPEIAGHAEVPGFPPSRE